MKVKPGSMTRKANRRMSNSPPADCKYRILLRRTSVESSSGGQVSKEGILPVVSLCVERPVVSFPSRASGSNDRVKGQCRTIDFIKKLSTPTLPNWLRRIGAIPSFESLRFIILRFDILRFYGSLFPGSAVFRSRLQPDPLFYPLPVP